ncbi:STING domain-containing protein [Roseivivax marinus]|uniref:STING domain-containing protein n=1 Tax=Roseivivax marinus TaxID=1379903 RepID=UPI00103AC2B9|nr:STING domain-containing protein [Roseivivax marinus]
MFSWVRSNNIFWWVSLVVSASLILLVLTAALISDPENSQFSWTSLLQEAVSDAGLSLPVNLIGRLSQNDTVYTITVGILFSVISASLLFIFKINSVRKIAIQAIAYGYFENFLIRLVQHCSRAYSAYRIIIVMPTFQLVEYPDVYLEDIKHSLRKLGVTPDIERTDEKFGRYALFVQRKNNPPLPIFIDVPTTLKTLRKILELEADMPAGRVVEHRWWRQRFLHLRREFERAIEQLLPQNSWGNVAFIRSEERDHFEDELRRHIEVNRAGSAGGSNS